MPRAEKRAIEFLRRHMAVILVGLVALGALALRFAVRGYITGDMEEFLIPWMRALREGGIPAVLALENYDYNVAYLLLLWPASALPVGDMVAVKAVSILFEYLCAALMAAAARSLWPAGGKTLCAAVFAGTLLLPIPFANGALWGQCDAVYTAFLLACLVFLLRERYTPAFLLFGLALCFKLQAIFFLPVLVMLYFTRRAFSALQFLWGPALVFLLGLFAGRGPLGGFAIYLEQAGRYRLLYADYPNIYTPFRDADYSVLAPAGILFCVLVLFCALAFVVLAGLRLQGDSLVLLAVWCVMTCCMFLPSVHDRYAYVAELLVWLFFFAKPGAKRFALAVLVNLVPVLVYVRALAWQAYLTQMQMSLVNILVYVLVSGTAARYLWAAKKEKPVLWL